MIKSSQKRSITVNTVKKNQNGRNGQFGQKRLKTIKHSQNSHYGFLKKHKKNGQER